jgi:hypothetical protein
MPTVGRSVQFRGIDAAVKAYENQSVPAWGLFQGAQFLSKYEGNSVGQGAELLEQFLTALDQRSADGVTYTLCIYDGLTDGEKIKSTTKYDGSFNFRLIDNIESYNGSKGAYIAGLEKKIADLENDEPDPTPKEQIFAGLGKILEHPDVQQMLATKVVQIMDGLSGTITGLFKNVVPMQQTQTRPAAIGAANASEENLKLQQAVNILVEIDSELGTHLLQLATIAKADPSKYNLLIGMLKTFA